MARTVYQRICLHCQNPFDTIEKRKRYCSRSCFIQFQKQSRPDIICDYCGLSFKRPPSQIRKASRHYCSMKCYYHLSIDERFFQKVEKQENHPYCWIWKGAIQNGYGVFGYGAKRKHVKSHRFSFEYYYGPIPDGFLVMHNCPEGDNPACVNPEHLLLGYSKDNSLDMVNKMRQAYGEKNSGHKLSEEQVIEIINLRYKNDAKYLSYKYKITRESVYNIWNRNTWKHLTLKLP